MSKDNENNSEKKFNALSVGLFWAQRITGAALQIVILTCAGRWFDQYFNTNPWGILAGACLGMASMLYSFLKIAHDFQKDSSNRSE